jgi:hypothetical protein
MATQIDVDNEGNEYPLSLSSDAEADQIIEIINGGITKLNEVNGEAVPGYFSNKLDKVIETKSGIAGAIEESGVGVPEDAPFAVYPVLIMGIADSIRNPIAASLDEINGEVIEPDIPAKLEALSNTKNGIAGAIADKGVEVSDNANFASYESLIAQIQGGPELTEQADSYADQLLNILGTGEIQEDIQ